MEDKCWKKFAIGLLATTNFLEVLSQFGKIESCLWKGPSYIFQGGNPKKEIAYNYQPNIITKK
jgi:hypothetical protein